MGENSRDVSYSHTTVALHYHQYRAMMRLGDHSLLLSPGDVTLSPPGMVSSYELSGNGFHWCIHFHPVRGEAGPLARLPFHLRSRPRLTLVLERIQQITDWHRRSLGRRREAGMLRAAASAALQEILLYLSSERELPRRESPAGKASAALEQAVERIDGNLQRPLYIPELAREVDLSQNYLSCLFRKRYGTTIQHYVLMRRMELARHLLLTTKDRVKEIGVKVGLPDPQHFNKLFRRVAGISPSGFRNNWVP